MLCTNSKCSDQSARMRRLIRTFAVRTCHQHRLIYGDGADFHTNVCGVSEFLNVFFAMSIKGVAFCGFLLLSSPPPTPADVDFPELANP